jgi:hypothetical protein
MKKNLILIGLLIGGFFIVKPANAQLHVNVNIGVQPAWGPVGYDYAEYYYLPDIEAYYCVPSRQFVYFDDNRWITSSYLPGRWTDYDLYSGYKIVMNERQPWNHFNNDRSRYAPYRYRHDQIVIRDGRGGNYGRSYNENRGGNRDWNKGRDQNRDRDYNNREGNHGRENGNSWGRDRDHNNNNRNDNRNGSGRDHDDNNRNHDNGGSHGRGGR